MDADKPSINLSQLENEKAKAVWTAEKARRIAENDARNRTQPVYNSDKFRPRS